MRRILAERTYHVLSRPPTRYIPEGVPFASFYPAAEPEFGGILPFLGRLLKRLLFSILIFTASVVSYGCFYVAVMPNYSVVAPLYFDYTGTPAPPQSLQYHHHHLPRRRKGLGSELVDHHHLTVVQSLPSPWAQVDLFARHSSWETGHIFGYDEVVPHTTTLDRLLIPRQAYFVEVVLQLPETELNQQQAGMFGVTVELKTVNGTGLALSRRATRFPHQSAWIRRLQKILLLAPLLVGALEESRSVYIPSFRHFVESQEHPVVRVAKAVERESCGIICIFAISHAHLSIAVSLTSFVCTTTALCRGQDRTATIRQGTRRSFRR